MLFRPEYSRPDLRAFNPDNSTVWVIDSNRLQYKLRWFDVLSSGLLLIRIIKWYPKLKVNFFLVLLHFQKLPFKSPQKWTDKMNRNSVHHHILQNMRSSQLFPVQNMLQKVNINFFLRHEPHIYIDHNIRIVLHSNSRRKKRDFDMIREFKREINNRSQNLPEFIQIPGH